MNLRAMPIRVLTSPETLLRYQAALKIPTRAMARDAIARECKRRTMETR